MSELKRPERYVPSESIKPKFKEITEFYTQKITDYQDRLKQLNEYADAIENEISVLKENSKVDVLLDNTDKQLVVVPKFVGDSIESLYAYRSVYKAIRIILDKVEQPGDVNNDWIDTYDWLQERKNVKIFEKAWVCGYAVEKEKLYRVVLLKAECDDEWILFKNSKGHFVDFASNNDGFWQQHFTEREIKANDERYWPFAVQVDEVEDA